MIIPNENIPEHLYWKPDDSAPAHSDLASLTLIPGRHKVVTIKLHPYAGKTFLSLNRLLLKIDNKVKIKFELRINF